MLNEKLFWKKLLTELSFETMILKLWKNNYEFLVHLITKVYKTLGKNIVKIIRTGRLLVLFTYEDALTLTEFNESNENICYTEANTHILEERGAELEFHLQEAQQGFECCLHCTHCGPVKQFKIYKKRVNK